MGLVVQKFGGTSVGSVDRIRQVAQLIAKSSPDEQKVIVVSAMSGETNRLVNLAFEMSKNPHAPSYDMLLASGEQVACSLTAMALQEIGIAATPMLAFQVGIHTDQLFSNARIKHIDTEPLLKLLQQGMIPVIAGFQGVTESDEDPIPRITTLGRGGSDTSAVAIAIALKAQRCDIFTDVDGVYTCDPRLVPHAKRIEKISFDEMMELASLGAKVLHMRSVELAAKYQLPLRVLSTFHPENGGTLVVPTHANDLESPLVSALSAESGESLISLQMDDKMGQRLSVFFKPLAELGINVDVINKTSADSLGRCTLSFTVPRPDAKRACDVLKMHSPRIESTALSKISIVGIGMRTHSGVAARMFEALEDQHIPIHLVTTSEIKVSVLIPESEKDKAIRTLHEVFDMGSSS
jgi:aspartate kinase